MARLRHTTLIALLGSLTVHTGATVAALWLGEHVPVRRQDAAAGQARPARQPILPPPEQSFGERAGIGTALADLEAPRDLQSPHDAQDQPLLGLFAEGPLREGEQSPARALASAESRPALPEARDWATLSEALRAGQSARSAAGEVERSERGDQQGDQQGQQADAASDPGPEAGREVDLFTREASAEYQAGRAVAREGREHKLRGLRRGLSAFLDLGFLPRPIEVRFRIEVDEEGTPLEVDVVESSGSDAVDQALRKALFNSWFEPDPSGTGRDLGKPFHFTLRIL